MVLRRLYQTFAHPQLFHQTVQLTDGSTIRVVATSNARPFVKVGVDSLSHPSWNPRLRNRMQLSEHGEVARFKERFSGMGEGFLEDFGTMLDTSVDRPPAEKASTRPAKKSA